MKFLGYRRSNSTVGVRNHVLIFPTVVCSTEVSRMISNEVPGTVYANHSCGCAHVGEDKEQAIRTMVGITGHPNVAGVLLVGNGCELITPDVIAEELAKVGQRVEIVNIQEAGGTTKCVEEGKRLAERLLAEASSMNREPINVSELFLGMECGGSDAFSGLTANPSAGVASDLLIGEGGTAMFSETTEMLGAEEILARRAVDDEVSKRIYEMIASAEARAMSFGADIRGAQPAPGNIEGGLTTIEEKSLGCIHKGGSTTIMEVVKYGEKPRKKGLILMDGTAYDVMSNIGMLASGAQIIVFSTGRGTPLGSPIAPVIKMSTNSKTYKRMEENFDINAGVIIDGEGTIQSVGRQIFDKVLKVASGELVRAEILGHHEFDIHSMVVI
ncbi:MAG: UxaA family hydrolase [Deltaproteobacteria bacterium]|nr:UxaA family hydrolase [Deltaproteobacteria bacterium]